MRKHNKLTALAMAGALALSNFGALAIPMTALAAPTDTAIKIVENNAGNWQAGGTGVSAEIGETKTFTVYIQDDGNEITGNNLIKKLDVTGTGKTAVTVGTPTLYSGDKDENDEIWSVSVKVDGSLTKKLANTDEAIVEFGTTAKTTAVAGSKLTISFTDTNTANGKAKIALADSTDTTKAITKSELYVAARSVAFDDVYTVIALLGDSGDAVGAFTIPDDQSAAEISYKSSNENIFTVSADDYKDKTPTITAKSAGTANLEVTYTYDKATTKKTSTYKIPVTIKAAAEAVQMSATDAKLSPTNRSVDVKATVTNTILTAEQNIYWVSDDTRIATVSGKGQDATITAAGNGTVNIYAVATDDKVYAETLKKYSDLEADDVALLAIASGVVKGTVSVTSADFDVTIAPVDSSLSVLLNKQTSTFVAANDDSINPGAEASLTKIKFEVKSSDETVATATVDTTTGQVTVKGLKAGKATIDVTGTYKVVNEKTGANEDKVLKTSIEVNVIDPDDTTAEDAAAEADKAKADAAAQKKAAEEAQKEAATQKAAAETAAKEAAAQKDAAAKAATAQKAAEDKAAETEKKLTDAQAKVSLAEALTKNAGKTKKVSGSSFVTDEDGAKAVAVKAAKNAKSVTIGKTVKIAGNTYKVRKINAKAFTGKSIRTIVIDAKNIKTVDKNAFKGTKATKLQVKNASKAVKKQFKTALKVKKIKTVTGVK